MLRIVAPESRSYPTQPAPSWRKIHTSSSTVTSRLGVETPAAGATVLTEGGGVGRAGGARFAAGRRSTPLNESRTEAGAGAGSGATAGGVTGSGATAGGVAGSGATAGGVAGSGATAGGGADAGASGCVGSTTILAGTGGGVGFPVGLSAMVIPPQRRCRANSA